MYINDHPPPHFHAEYSEYEAVINIDTLAVVAGNLPSRALGLTIEWASLHQNDLRNLWVKARNHESLEKLDPLK
jgi:hypothetical protein